jgi:hypothetical protein
MQCRASCSRCTSSRGLSPSKHRVVRCPSMPLTMPSLSSCRFPERHLPYWTYLSTGSTATRSRKALPALFTYATSQTCLLRVHVCSALYDANGTPPHRMPAHAPKVTKGGLPAHTSSVIVRLGLVGGGGGLARKGSYLSGALRRPDDQGHSALWRASQTRWLPNCSRDRLSGSSGSSIWVLSGVNGLLPAGPLCPMPRASSRPSHLRCCEAGG